MFRACVLLVVGVWGSLLLHGSSLLLLLFYYYCRSDGEAIHDIGVSTDDEEYYLQELLLARYARKLLLQKQLHKVSRKRFLRMFSERCTSG